MPFRQRPPPPLPPPKPSYTTEPAPTLEKFHKPCANRILSPAEVADKRAKILCFGCDKKYSPGHTCKKHHLFMVEVEERHTETECLPEDELQVDEQPHISLHAISGSLGTSMLKVDEFVGHDSYTSWWIHVALTIFWMQL